MKKSILAAMLLFAVSVSVFAADEEPVISEPIIAITTERGSCSSLSPATIPVVSTPISSTCAPAPTTCQTTTSAPEVFYQVPVKKKVWAEEQYTVNEKHVEHAKEVITKIIEPNRPRAARVAKKTGSPVVAYKDPHHEKTYLKPIKIETIVPVTKTRKVAVEIEEQTLIPEKEFLRNQSRYLR